MHYGIQVLLWHFSKNLLIRLSGTHLFVYRSGHGEHYSDLSEPWSSSGELFCSRKRRAVIWYSGETFQNNFFELFDLPHCRIDLSPKKANHPILPLRVSFPPEPLLKIENENLFKIWNFLGISGSPPST